MPLVEMPFEPHFDREFNVQVDTIEEFNICEMFRNATKEEVDEQEDYFSQLVQSNPQIVNNRIFMFTSTVMLARKKTLEKQSGFWPQLKLWFNSLSKPVPQTRNARNSAVVTGCGLLTSMLDNIAIDHMAYSKMGDDSNDQRLPSVQYAENRSKAALTWGIINDDR